MVGDFNEHGRLNGSKKLNPKTFGYGNQHKKSREWCGILSERPSWLITYRISCKFKAASLCRLAIPVVEARHLVNRKTMIRPFSIMRGQVELVNN